jgi:hypothetical protein
MSFFSFTKSETRKPEQDLSGGVGSGRGEDMWKGCRRLNKVQIVHGFVNGKIYLLKLSQELYIYI